MQIGRLRLRLSAFAISKDYILERISPSLLRLCVKNTILFRRLAALFLITPRITILAYKPLHVVGVRHEGKLYNVVFDALVISLISSHRPSYSVRSRLSLRQLLRPNINSLT